MAKQAVKKTDYRQVAIDLKALHNSGAIKIPGLRAKLPAKLAATTEAGEIEPGILSRILEFYENNKGILSFLLGLFRGGKKPAPMPSRPPAVAPPPPPPPPPDVVDVPVVQTREIASLRLKHFWIQRKNTPWVEGGGRKLLSSDQFQGVLSRADPLQAGDRVTFDCTPSDQFGRPFMPGDAANVLMKDIEYEVVGGVGELQLQDPDGIGFDPTPTVFVPWEGGTVRPGFQAELGLIARYTNPRTGAVITAEAPVVRIRPWA